jgi:Rrf2 family iron-sulfur cluster assembly transcriptional regulator
MRLSKDSQLAVTVLVEVGLHEHDGPVSLAAIQSRHDISTTRLEQVFSKLRRANLVDSTRGPGGGYCLAMASEKISLADIFAAIEPVDPHSGKMHIDSVSNRICQQLNQKIQQELQDINLRQLLGEHRLEDARRSRLADQAMGLRAVRPSRPDMPWWPVPSVMSAS